MGCTLWDPAVVMWQVKSNMLLIRYPFYSPDIHDWSCKFTFHTTMCTWHYTVVFIMTTHEHHGISTQWQPTYLFNSLFRLMTKTISKPHIAGSLWGESTGDQWIPLTKGQNVERISISWCYHQMSKHISQFCTIQNASGTNTPIMANKYF